MVNRVRRRGIEVLGRSADTAAAPCSRRFRARRILACSGFLLALALAACFPNALDEAGRRCDRERRCGEGFTCFEGFCARPEGLDAGPDNVLTHGGMEQVNGAGEPLGWQPLGGQLTTDTTVVHEGVRSARLFSPDGGERLGLLQTADAELRDTRPLQVWCARAWVRSTHPDGGHPVQLLLRERPIDGGAALAESDAGPVPVDARWTVLEQRYEARGADRLDVRLISVNPAEPQDMLWVDDVRLKRSPTEVCSW